MADDPMTTALAELGDASQATGQLRRLVAERKAPASALHLAEYRRHKAQQRVDQARAAQLVEMPGGGAA